MSATSYAWEFIDQSEVFWNCFSINFVPENGHQIVNHIILFFFKSFQINIANDRKWFIFS